MRHDVYVTNAFRTSVYGTFICELPTMGSCAVSSLLPFMALLLTLMVLFYVNGNKMRVSASIALCPSLAFCEFLGFSSPYVSRIQTSKGNNGHGRKGSVSAKKTLQMLLLMTMVNTAGALSLPIMMS